MQSSKKVIIKLLDLLNIKKKINKFRMCCKEKDATIRLLNQQISEYNERFVK
jgi:hypothetical protein